MHWKDKLKVLFFLNLTVDFLSKFAKNTHPEKFTGLVFNTQSGQVEILGQAVLLLKMRNYLVFLHICKACQIFKTSFAVLPVFYPVKLSGLFGENGRFEPQKRPFSKNMVTGGRVSKTRPPFFQATT